MIAAVCLVVGFAVGFAAGAVATLVAVVRVVERIGPRVVYELVCDSPITIEVTSQRPTAPLGSPPSASYRR